VAAGLTGLAILTGLYADDPKRDAAAPAQGAAKAEPAVKAKPLTDSVEKGLAYLVNQQHDSGGWGQGGGWRNDTSGKGGRIEGTQAADPPDVANTCVATLALLRAGHTPKDGKYAKNVARAVDFICKNIEKADQKSLYVTELRGTQVQGKVGPYVDTFLAALVLAEIKGKMPDEKTELRLVTALDKTVSKIENNQKADGTFAGNTGWASVFSQGLASKGLNRAQQVGAMVQPQALVNAEKNAVDSFDAKNGTFTALAGKPAAAPTGGGVPTAPAAGLTRGASPAPAAGESAPSDAGVPIYSVSNGVAALQEAVNTNKELAQKARLVLAKPTASKDEKKKAEDDLKRFDDVEKTCEQATQTIVKRLTDQRFIQGFGSNGGEEFLSYINISEALVVKSGKDWQAWDKAMADNLTRIQDKDGSWSGHHCITGKTFCTATALLVVLADRAPVPMAAQLKGGR
jgi:hypothetical protein